MLHSTYLHLPPVHCFMAKKKVSARKTRQSAAAHAADQSKNTGSKAASLAPSNASSPSPQPFDQVQVGRRKGLPRRSPSQNDPSKGIVFSFRFQHDSAMSMAVDIHSYDQQFDSESATETGNGKALPTAAADSEPTAATTNEKSLAVSGPLDLSHIDNDDDSRSLDSSLYSPLTNAATSSELRLAGEKWSCDPTSYRSSNVFDKSRNLLILHTRKPAAGPLSSPRASIITSPQESTPSFHPYRRSTGSSSTSSLPSTPALSQSGSTSSSTSSSSSSPCSPSSPTPSHSGPTSTVSAGAFQQGKDDSCSADSLPAALELSGSRSTRFLKVRGLGGASGGRRMQVILVS